MNDLGYASSPAVLQYLKSANDYGIQTQSILEQHQIPLSILSNDTNRISGIAFQSLLKDLIIESKDPCFGLKSSRYVQAGSYSVLGYIVMNCKTLLNAIQLTPTYEKLVGDMGHTEILPIANKGLRMIWHCHYPDALVRPHMIANVIGSWVNFARFLIDKPDAKPVKIHFEFEKPNHQALLQFQEMFQCDMLFNQSFNAVEIDSNLLTSPMRQPDAQLLKTLENHAEILMANIDDKQSFAMKARSVIRGLLIEGIPRKEMVAKRLGLSERTMQRKLKEFDTSYQSLLDSVRLEQGKELLGNTQLSIQEIASRLGFSEPRSFHRVFKQKLGITPGEFREKQGYS